MVCAQSTTKLTWCNSARRTPGFFGQWSFGQRMLGGLSATPVLCHCLISLLQDHRDKRTATARLVQDVSIQRLWYGLLNITYAHVEQMHWKLPAREIRGVSLSSLGMKLCGSVSSHLTVSFLYCSLSLPYTLAWFLSDPSLASRIFNLKVLCHTHQPSIGGVLTLDVSWAVSLWLPCILCCDQGADTPCPRVERKTVVLIFLQWACHFCKLNVHVLEYIWWTFCCTPSNVPKCFLLQPCAWIPICCFAHLSVQCKHATSQWDVHLYLLPHTLTQCTSHRWCYWSSISYWNCHADWTLICLGSTSKIWRWQLWHSTFHCFVFLSYKFTQLHIQPADDKRLLMIVPVDFLSLVEWGLMMG